MTKRIALFLLATAAALVLALPLQSFAAEGDAGNPDVAIVQAAGGAAVDNASSTYLADTGVDGTEGTHKGIDWHHNWPILIIFAIFVYGAYLTAKGERERKIQRKLKEQQAMESSDSDDGGGRAE